MLHQPALSVCPLDEAGLLSQCNAVRCLFGAPQLHLSCTSVAPFDVWRCGCSEGLLIRLHPVDSTVVVIVLNFFGALHIIGFITRSSLQDATAARMQYCGSSQIILYRLKVVQSPVARVCVRDCVVC